MKTVNIIIAVLGRFAIFRILVGIVLANYRQLRNDSRQKNLENEIEITKKAIVTAQGKDQGNWYYSRWFSQLW